jgi:methionyl-tRNA synthetase
MVTRYFDGVVPQPGQATDAELTVQQTVADAVSRADEAIERFAIHDALAAIWTIVDELNGYITLQEPWALAKHETQRERLATVLYTTVDGLRALAVLLAPVIPQATQKLWTALGVQDALGELTEQPLRQAGSWGQVPVGTRVRGLEALFPRIEPAAGEAGA